MPRNILVLNDDGPNALGYTILGDVINQVFKDAKKVFLTTDKPYMGQSLSITHGPVESLQVNPIATDKYTVECKPVELVYVGMMRTKEFLAEGSFDMVICGINHGPNVGFDVMHSGTVGQAIMAAHCFGAASIAFSQDMEELYPTGDEQESERFMFSAGITAEFLRDHQLGPGDCYSVNIPVGLPKGWKSSAIAPYSKFRNPNLVEKREGHDIFELERGYVTFSEIRLSLTAPRFI